MPSHKQTVKSKIYQKKVSTDDSFYLLEPNRKCTVKTAEGLKRVLNNAKREKINALLVTDGDAAVNWEHYLNRDRKSIKAWSLFIPEVEQNKYILEICRLTFLEGLAINVRINKLPLEIGKLINLKTFLLMIRRLAYLPTEIGQLKSLRYLSLDDLQLTKIPHEIIQNSDLEILSLRKNKIEKSSGRTSFT